jgi:hypothetical protein
MSKRWLPPGYVALAHAGMSDSLRAVVERWSLPDAFVLETYMTSGRRAILRADAILDHFAEKMQEQS